MKAIVIFKGKKKREDKKKGRAEALQDKLKLPALSRGCSAVAVATDLFLVAPPAQGLRRGSSLLFLPLLFVSLLDITSHFPHSRELSLLKSTSTEPHTTVVTAPDEL